MKKTGKRSSRDLGISGGLLGLGLIVTSITGIYGFLQGTILASHFTVLNSYVSLPVIRVLISVYLFVHFLIGLALLFQQISHTQLLFIVATAGLGCAVLIVQQQALCALIQFLLVVVATGILIRHDHQLPRFSSFIL